MKNYPLLFISSFFLIGCQPNKIHPVNQYLALMPAQPQADLDERVKNFVNLYNHLEKKPVAAEAEKTYAESLFFNDTLVTLNTRMELIDYLQSTQEQVQSLTVTVLNVLENGDDIFIQWKMRTKFQILGKDNDVESIGISHLRFNSDGKIILHQDYWDSTNGFFQHIPMLGGIIKWIKKRLH